MKWNLISIFFRRVWIAVILLVIIWLGGMYTFQKYLMKQQFVSHRRTSAEAVLAGVAGAEPGVKSGGGGEDAALPTRKELAAAGLVLVKMYDGSGGIFFVFESDNPLHRGVLEKRRDFGFWAFPTGDSFRYRFHEFTTKAYLQLLSPVDLGDGRRGYMEWLEEIDIAAIHRFNRQAWLLLAMIAGTVCLMTAVIYPLVYFAYRKLKQSRKMLLESNLHIIAALGKAIAERDSDTDIHNFRVTWYSICLAERLKLPEEEIRTLMKGAFLHDVGKIGIRDNILLKPAGFSEAEYEVMKGHVELGAQIVDGIPWLEDSRDVILYHHEKFDGSGYAQGLRGDWIPKTARIFAIVDVFDALASDRPYKKAFPYAEVIRILEEGKDAHFDPEILEAFFSIAKELYGSCAQASRQELRERLGGKVRQYFGIDLRRPPAPERKRSLVEKISG